jgi:hypothetical protein
VRTFGSYEQLNDRFKHYLTSANVVELFAKVISRLEEDFSMAIVRLVVL